MSSISFFDAPFPKNQKSVFGVTNLEVFSQLEHPCRRFHQVADYEYSFEIQCVNCNIEPPNCPMSFILNC
jgi:hypothetical protein